MALTLKGDLAAQDAIPWFLHRGQLLSLVGWISRVDAQTITMALSGPPDLLDAMEVACSLGPGNVQVDELIRAKHEFEQVPNRFELLSTPASV